MKVYKVTDKEFAEFGRVLGEYDFSEHVEKLLECEAPDDSLMYVASIPSLEGLAVAKELETRCYAGLPIQIGCTSGVCNVMNALEYHKASEFNIAAEDVILILGKQTDIKEGVFDASLCKAFLLPKGVGVEIYATSLHYAPMSIDGKKYRVSVVLPKGTNLAKPEFEAVALEEKMCCGSNKWLLAHPDSPEAKEGKFVGLIGKNYTIEDMEF